MDKLCYATLENGEKLPYLYRPDPPCGGMKHTYFGPDRTYVVQFFNDPKMGQDDELRKRLEAIIGRYNPTKSEKDGGAKGNTEKLADYFAKRFCWPTHIVVEPEFGIVCPAYPKNFYFDEKSSAVLNLKGKDKKSTWFTYKHRRYIDKMELGDLERTLKMSMLLARSIRRLHQAGLAHSDLSCNNVLIDPKTASCIIIDIDSLVVPGIFPPEVIGTRGYIAPEIMAGYLFPRGHPARKQPSVYTDLHSLAVLIYEYLFCRHPLYGPKIYSTRSQEEDDFLTLGPSATFIENPYDKSNRPDNLTFTIGDMGPVLEKLFLRSFVEGLHDPQLRPSAMEWERAIADTIDLLYRCHNPKCEKGYFVFYHEKACCPYCGTKLSHSEFIQLTLYKQINGSHGQWRSYRRVNIQENKPLYLWHIFDHCYPDEKTDAKEQALVIKRNGKWFLMNKAMNKLFSPKGYFVPIGENIALENHCFFRTSYEEHGVLIRVSIKQI